MECWYRYGLCLPRPTSAMKILTASVISQDRGFDQHHFTSRWPLLAVHVTGVLVPETCYRSDTQCCCRGRCLLYISRVFLLLSSLYHRIHAHGSRQLPYRNSSTRAQRRKVGNTSTKAYHLIYFIFMRGPCLWGVGLFAVVGYIITCAGARPWSSTHM